MADSFAVRLLAKVEALMLKTVGLRTVTLDGKSMTYDDLQTLRTRLKREIGRETGTRPACSRISLEGP